MEYSVKKTLWKTTEAPVLIITFAELAAYIAAQCGADIPQDIIYKIIIAGYGTFKGIQNWFKNRNNKNMKRRITDK